MTTDNIRLRVAGENSVMLYFGQDSSPAVNARVQAALPALQDALGQDLVNLVPSYASILIIYRSSQAGFGNIAQRIRAALHNLQDLPMDNRRHVTLPVYYAPESGADLQALATRAGLSVEAVIRLHCGVEYRVYAIGFAPGFAYLGDVDPRIATPRLASPRQVVPRGAVAIADRQTAVYPAPSPGGWNLIGRCPTPLFDPAASPAMPFSVGDSVRFEAIGRDQYLALGGELE